MSLASPQIYSAAQIARALRKKRQAVQRLLSNVIPFGKVLAGGNETNAWSFSTLLESIRAALLAESRRRGFRDVEALLNGAAEVWPCPREWNSVGAPFQQRAFKLRTALALPIDKQHEIPPSELAQLGANEFQKAFGYSISGKQWKRLFDRTIQRDGGCENFQRMEIYLDDAAFARNAPKSAIAAKLYMHRPLDEIISNLENKATPTAQDREWIFDSAFNHFEKLLSENEDRREQKAIKKSLIKYLFSAVPGISKTESALRRVFEINLQKWRIAGRLPSALLDLRRLKSGNFRTPEFVEDKKKIRDLGHRLHGNESLAYRRLRKRGELTDELVNYYAFNIRVNKSAVPKSIRDEVTPQIKAMLDQYQGEREARLRGPAIPRDWSDTLPGDFLSGDDTTLNHPFSTPNQNGGQVVMRGEFLLHNDLRSTMPLHPQLIAGHYNGRHLVTPLLKIHDEVGLPRIGGYWEKGIWDSRWMPGVPKKHSIHWRETELRLRSMDGGFEFGALKDFERRHAISPRSKPIEGVFRIIQAMMADQPGYVGRNARLNNYKPMQDFIARCNRGTEDPRNEGIMPMEHWMKKIEEILEEYADEPQNGKMLPGVSPREMWEDGLDKRPLRKLSIEQRIGLATNRQIIRRIPNTGIVLHDVPQYVYANEELREWQMKGLEIVVFYNIDVPELLTVSNLAATEFFNIKGIGLPAMTATRDQLGEASRQIRGFMKPARVLHGQITHRKKYVITRDADESPVTELGRFHHEEEAKFKSEKSETTRKLRKIQVQAATTGAAVNHLIRNPDRVLTGLNREKEILERIARKQLAKTQIDHE